MSKARQELNEAARLNNSSVWARFRQRELAADTGASQSLIFGCWTATSQLRYGLCDSRGCVAAVLRRSDERGVTPMLKVMTLNCNGPGTKHGSWDQRVDLLAELLKRHRPDVVALQAVRRPADPEHMDQASQLAAASPGYEW